MLFLVASLEYSVYIFFLGEAPFVLALLCYIDISYLGCVLFFFAWQTYIHSVFVRSPPRALFVSRQTWDGMDQNMGNGFMLVGFFSEV